MKEYVVAQKAETILSEIYFVLCDLEQIQYEGFSQEECGVYMGVARTTVQQIYNRARQKIADALVEGIMLKIEGGDYILCSGEEKTCGCGGCKKHRCQK